MTVEVPAEVAWLTEAIQAALDAPVNYLYRAEEWLVRGAVMEACADFRAAHRRAVEGLLAAHGATCTNGISTGLRTG